ncbi:MAG: acetolactate synthase small subunit, partial [Corynebacterium urealyticum]
QVVEAAKLFRAHVVDVSPDSLIIEATGTPSKLQALLDVLEPFGIRELIESSVTAMSRGPRSMAPSR